MADFVFILALLPARPTVRVSFHVVLEVPVVLDHTPDIKGGV